MPDKSNEGCEVKKSCSQDGIFYEDQQQQQHDYNFIGGKQKPMRRRFQVHEIILKDKILNMRILDHDLDMSVMTQSLRRSRHSNNSSVI